LSLKIALEQLFGSPCYHMTEVFEHPEHVGLWHAVADGETINWGDVFAGYAAAVDTPACLFWPELLQAYPQALVVLSVRDGPSWFESCHRTIFARPSKEPQAAPGWSAMMEAVTRSRMPVGPTMSRAAALEGFARYNQTVRQRVPAGRLLVWQARDGWAPLCAALNIPIPDEPFPHLNTRETW
jgi:hypothetical protein